MKCCENCQHAVYVEDYDVNGYRQMFADYCSKGLDNPDDNCDNWQEVDVPTTPEDVAYQKLHERR